MVVAIKYFFGPSVILTLLYRTEVRKQGMPASRRYHHVLLLKEWQGKHDRPFGRVSSPGPPFLFQVDNQRPQLPGPHVVNECGLSLSTFRPHEKHGQGGRRTWHINITISRKKVMLWTNANRIRPSDMEKQRPFMHASVGLVSKRESMCRTNEYSIQWGAWHASFYLFTSKQTLRFRLPLASTCTHAHIVLTMVRSPKWRIYYFA